MKTDIWMPVYIADFIRDTLHLESEDQGFYLLVLVHLWNNNGSIEKTKLRKTLKLSLKKFEKKMQKIIIFFDCFYGELFQKRLYFELEKSQKNRELKSKMGKMGGRPKTNRFLEKNQKRNQIKTPSPSPSPSPLNKKNIEEREKDFFDAVMEFKNITNENILIDFYEYWSEQNKEKNKMRFEYQKTWDTNRRLKTWMNRKKEFGQSNSGGWDD